MYVEFTKDHVAGFGKGYILKCRSEKHALRLVESGFAKESGEKEYLAFKPKAVEHLSAYKKRVAEDAEKLIKEKTKEAKGE